MSWLPSPRRWCESRIRMANSPSSGFEESIVEAGDAEHLALALAVDRDEADLAVVVDVAVAHEHRLGDLLDGAEEAVLGRLGRERLDHLGPQGLVFGPDRAHAHLLAADSRPSSRTWSDTSR